MTAVGTDGTGEGMADGAGLLDTLLTVSALLQRDMARYFRGSGLTEARVAVLWVLQTRGPSTQQAVASTLGVSARNVSGLVDALESDGFVRRRAHPTDRRAVLVSLTPRSARFMSQMQAEHEQLDTALRGAVPIGDGAAFERGLDAVATRLRELVESSHARLADPGDVQ